MTQLQTIWVTAIITMAMVLVGKYIWDRYLSQSSRVTQTDMKLSLLLLEERLQRGALELNGQIATIESRLVAGTSSFKKVSVCMATVCMVQLKICEEMKIDCDEIRKLIVESGMDL